MLSVARDNIPKTDKISNGSFVDDLLCLTQRLCNLHIQADKLSKYADWAALQVSGTKTKATGILHELYGLKPSRPASTERI